MIYFDSYIFIKNVIKFISKNSHILKNQNSNIYNTIPYEFRNHIYQNLIHIKIVSFQVSIYIFNK